MDLFSNRKNKRSYGNTIEYFNVSLIRILKFKLKLSTLN